MVNIYNRSTEAYNPEAESCQSKLVGTQFIKYMVYNIPGHSITMYNTFSRIDLAKVCHSKKYFIVSADYRFLSSFFFQKFLVIQARTL